MTENSDPNAPGDPGPDLREFLVRGNLVTGLELGRHLARAPGIEMVERVSEDIVVLRMTDQDRAALADRFPDLIIEHNAPLDFQ